MARIRSFAPLLYGFAGALLIWGGSLLIPDRYTSSAIIRLEVEPFPTADVINIAWQEVISRKNLKNLIERFNLYPSERDRLPLEDVIEDAKKNDITLDILRDRDVRVAFTYPDPAAAQAVAKDIMKAMVNVTDEKSRREPGWGRLELKQAAAPSEAVSSGLAFWRPRRYASHGVLAVKKLDTFVVDRNAAAQHTAELEENLLAPATLSGMIGRFNLYNSGRDGASPESIAHMTRDLRIDPRVNIVTIKFTYTDAQIAQKTVNALVTYAVDAEIVARRKLPECASPSGPGSLMANADRIMPDIASPDVPELPDATRPSPEDCRHPQGPEWKHVINLLDPASLPEEPDGPSRPILAVFGCFLGLGLWAAIKH